MKFILFITVLLISTVTFSQCGTWRAQPERVGEWQTKDNQDTGRLKNFIAKDSIQFTYTNWLLEKNTMSGACMSKCGCGDMDVYSRIRTDKITGIKQAQYKFVKYKYINR